MPFGSAEQPAKFLPFGGCFGSKPHCKGTLASTSSWPARLVHFGTSSGAIVPANVERTDIEADHIVILVAEHHALAHRFRHLLLFAHGPKHVRSNGGQKFVCLRLLGLEGEP